MEQPERLYLCSVCGDHKPHDEFYASEFNNPGALPMKCKECKKRYRRELYQRQKAKAKLNLAAQDHSVPVSPLDEAVARLETKVDKLIALLTTAPENGRE